MFHKLSILSVIILCGCSQPQESNHRATVPPAVTLSDSIPAGFSVIEQHPNGYFIRLASAERADATTIRAIAATFSGKFDRVDLCLDVAHERGDEYLAIIDGKVYDYEKYRIYSLNSISK